MDATLGQCGCCRGKGVWIPASLYGSVSMAARAKYLAAGHPAYPLNRTVGDAAGGLPRLPWDEPHFMHWDTGERYLQRGTQVLDPYLPGNYPSYWGDPSLYTSSVSSPNLSTARISELFEYLPFEPNRWAKGEFVDRQGNVVMQERLGGDYVYGHGGEWHGNSQDPGWWIQQPHAFRFTLTNWGAAESWHQKTGLELFIEQQKVGYMYINRPSQPYRTQKLYKWTFTCPPNSIRRADGTFPSNLALSGCEQIDTTDRLVEVEPPQNGVVFVGDASSVTHPISGEQPARPWFIRAASGTSKIWVSWVTDEPSCHFDVMRSTDGATWELLATDPRQGLVEGGDLTLPPYGWWDRPKSTRAQVEAFPGALTGRFMRFRGKGSDWFFSFCDESPAAGWNHYRVVAYSFASGLRSETPSVDAFRGDLNPPAYPPSYLWDLDSYNEPFERPWMYPDNRWP